MDLKDKVALVTGAGRGIGRGVALCLAREGAAVAINYRENRQAAEETLWEVRGLGVRAELFQADVAEGYAPVQQMVDAVAATFGQLDILVNNAGQRSPQDSVCDSNPEDMRRLLDTHFFGSYHCTKAAIPHLRKRERGDILFISSIATAQRPANRAPYVVAKSAVEAFADVVAKEERPNGIRVNTILAGIVETEWGETIFRERGYDDVAAVYEYAPFGRLCRPEDIGNVIAFLCSDRGAYLTGAAIAVSGGPNDWMPPRR